MNKFTRKEEETLTFLLKQVIFLILRKGVDANEGRAGYRYFK